MILALTLLSGCRERDPEEVARDFVETLEAYRGAPSTSRLKHAWELLDADTRAPLEERAKAASATLGVKVAPWQLLRYNGLIRGDRVTRVESDAVGDDRARVVISYAWAVPKSAGGPATEPEPSQLSLVSADDGWKVVLPLAGVKPDAEVPGMPPAERLPAAPPEGSR